MAAAGTEGAAGAEAEAEAVVANTLSTDEPDTSGTAGSHMSAKQDDDRSGQRNSSGTSQQRRTARDTERRQDVMLEFFGSVWRCIQVRAIPFFCFLFVFCACPFLFYSF